MTQPPAGAPSSPASPSPSFPYADLLPDGPAEGAAFPVLVRVLATVLVAWTVRWGWQSRELMASVSWSWAGLALMAAALAMVLWCLVWIWRSRIRVDGDGLSQSWMWDKQVRWEDITQVRLVEVPGLSAVIAPRLVVRARGTAFVQVFYLGNRRVLATVCAVLVGSGKVPTRGS